MFDHGTKSAVWFKATPVATHDPQKYRKDRYGFWIAWQDYGNRQSQYGWEVDHIKPVAKGGTDHLDNLQPLHWQNNAKKQDGHL